MDLRATVVNRCPRSALCSRAAPVNPVAQQALTALAALLLCCVMASAQMPRYDGVRINLWPTPRVVPADGKSAATVRAELRDASSRPVPDGTMVVFRVEGGALSLDGDERRQVVTTQTVAGSATVQVTSDATGTANVIAEVATGEGKNQVTIAFVAEGSSLLAGSSVVHVRGNWVGYALDLAIVEARDEAEVEYAGMVVRSPDVLQVDVNTLTLKAINAEIKVDGRILRANDISYNLLSGEGVLRRIGEEGVERKCFDCYSLQERDPDRDVSAETFRLDTARAGVWAVADGVSVHPHEKVVLRSATLYAGGERVIALPRYWVMAMPGYTGTTHSRTMGVNSEGQLAVDFPYFYRVDETRTGAVKIQRGATAGSVIARDDWSLALEEAYSSRGGEGAISLVGLPRNDWGVEWRDQRSLGSFGDGYFSVYSPDHQSYYGDANIYQSRGDRRLNLTASVRKPRGQDFSYAAAADWLTMNRPAGLWNSSYRLGTAIGLRHVAGYDEGIVAENNLYAALDFPRAYLAERTSLTPSVSNFFSWDTGGFSRNSLRSELRLRHYVSSDMSVHASYVSEYTSGDLAKGFAHLVNLDLRAYHGRNVSGYLTTNYDLTDDRFYGFGLVDYRLDENWRMGVAGTYFDYQDDSFSNMELSVARRLGPTEVGLRWSEASGRISLEFGDLRGLGTGLGIY